MFTRCIRSTENITFGEKENEEMNVHNKIKKELIAARNSWFKNRVALVEKGYGPDDYIVGYMIEHGITVKEDKPPVKAPSVAPLSVVQSCCTCEYGNSTDDACLDHASNPDNCPFWKPKETFDPLEFD